MIVMNKIMRKLKNYILPSLIGRGWGVGLLAVGLLVSFPNAVYAQSEDEEEEEIESGIKQPDRSKIRQDNYPTIVLRGKVVDQATGNVLPGVQIRALGYERYSAMTEEDGKYLHFYLKDLSALPEYSADEIEEAKKKAVYDDDSSAQEILLNHYLKDVVEIAKLYIYQSLPAEDLIGEGNIGLMTAVKALSTLESPDEADSFVGGLIMDAMDRAIYEDTDIRQRIDDMVEQINEINDKAKKMSEDMGRPVTIDELSEETGISREDIAEAMRLSGDMIEGLIP